MMKAPIAKKISKTLKIHGDTRDDPYFWMNEKENPEVISHLESENTYCDFMMQHTVDVQEQLYEEMKARYKKDDESLPYFFNEYWYIVRYEEGKEYPIFCRKHLTLEAEEEILINVNVLAEGKRPWRFFYDSWHIFDFIIVALCFIPIFFPDIDVNFFAV